MGSGWLKALEIRGPTAFLGFLAAALVSAGYHYSWLSFGGMPSWAAAATNVFAVLLAVLSMPWLGHLAAKPFRAWRRNRQHRASLLLHMQTLAREEALVFWQMVANGQRSVRGAVGGIHGHPGLEGLLARGLLTVVSQVGPTSVLVMPDQVWRAVSQQRDAAKDVLASLPAPCPSEYDRI